MFEKSDARNQQTHEQHNKMKKPLISEGAVRILSWPAYVAIAVILVGVAVLSVIQAFQ